MKSKTFFIPIIEWDLKEDRVHFVRLDNGEGEVAKFNTKKELLDWIKVTPDIDTSLFDIGIAEITEWV